MLGSKASGSKAPGSKASGPKAPGPKVSPKAASPALQLSLQFADPRHRALLPRHRVLRWVRAALQAQGEITVRIVGAEEGLALNQSYRCKAYATNVLSFVYAQEPLVQADLVICASVVEVEAAELGIGIEAHYAHLLVHGTLHAQGYDHETGEAQAQAMEDLETHIMAGLGFADPYAAKQGTHPLGSS